MMGRSASARTSRSSRRWSPPASSTWRSGPGQLGEQRGRHRGAARPQGRRQGRAGRLLRSGPRSLPGERGLLQVQFPLHTAENLVVDLPGVPGREENLPLRQQHRQTQPLPARRRVSPISSSPRPSRSQAALPRCSASSFSRFTTCSGVASSVASSRRSIEALAAWYFTCASARVSVCSSVLRTPRHVDQAGQREFLHHQGSHRHHERAQDDHVPARHVQPQPRGRCQRHHAAHTVQATMNDLAATVGSSRSRIFRDSRRGR